MKSLVKIVFVLFLFFTALLILFNATGLMSVEKIETYMKVAQEASPVYVAFIVSLLLFVDLFIAVPSLTVMILAGFFLGPVIGSVSAITGIVLAGVCGYLFSRRYGAGLLAVLITDPKEREDAIGTFRKHGPLIIIVSRAAPVLPEISACLAGLSGMNFLKFLCFWLLSSIPYVAIACYAGSVSSVQNPFPAILAAIGLTAFFFLAAALFKRSKNVSKLSIGA